MAKPDSYYDEILMCPCGRMFGSRVGYEDHRDECPVGRGGDDDCPHCAAKDQEIAALRERVKKAEAALTKIAGLDYTHAATNGMGHHAVTLAQRILRGEGE